jgi:hypothetical protein
MQITILVGNGFDIQAGLKTKYSDFYKYLKEVVSKKELSLIDNSIYSDIQVPENEEKWSNFEMGLMELAKECVLHKESNGEILTDEKLAQDKSEIEKYLGQYLNKVSSKFNVKDNANEIIIEFRRSFSEILTSLRPQGRDEINSVLPINNSATIFLNILDFNYTSLFKNSYELLDKNNIGELKNGAPNNKRIKMVKRHYEKLHGDTMKDMILGGNDRAQLGDIMQDSELRFYFLKSELDLSIGYNKYKRAKTFLDQTNLYCILGMSLGESDKTWWEKIIKNMSINMNKALIIFEYDSNENINDQPLFYTSGVRKIKNNFLNYLNDLNDTKRKSISDRIFVVYNSKLFNLGELSLVKEKV